jgi:transposase
MACEYVGIDLHRRRSVIVRQDRDGEVVKEVRIDNDPVALACEIEQAGPAPEVVLEATYGWYWAVDVLQATGARVHLAHPLGVTGWTHRRVKNDRVDAAGLADLLRLNRLPEAWIAPPQLRELRELVRYRAKLVALRSGLKAQIHSVLAKQGIAVPLTDLFGVAGMRLLADVQSLLDPAFRLRVQSLLDLIDGFDYEIGFFGEQIAHRLRGDRGYHALQTIRGVGPVLGAVFVAEIGDVTRFPRPSKLACWAGLTPRHRESDIVVHRGHITKQGSRLVRWAAIEAVQRQPVGSKQRDDYQRIAARRGAGIAKVAAARKLLTLVYYGLRDGDIRCLSRLAA